MIRLPGHRRVAAPLLGVALAAMPVASNAADCSVSAAAMNFGIYDVLSPTPKDSTTNVQVICVRTPPPVVQIVSYTLSLSVGAGSYAARTMSSGANTINYNLYVSPAMNASTIWGNGTGGTVTVSNTLPNLNPGNNVRAASHTIFGRIPAQQDVAVGTYSGNVILTMDY